jgi:hypothetical protein
MVANADALAVIPRLRIGAFESLGTLIHKLTHRTLHVEVRRSVSGGVRPAAGQGLCQDALKLPALVATYDETRLVPLAELRAFAWSTLARKVLKVAEIPF